MESEAESRTIPWREGTWTDAVGAIRRELENSSPHSVVERLDASLADTTRARIRIQRLGALIQLVAEDPEGRSAEQEAERADFRGAATAHLADGVPLLAASGKWEELREHPLFEALLDRVRAVTVEDVESIFDFERMAQCAKAFGMFLVTHSYVTGRYDDLWLGMRISNLFVEGQRTDGKGMFELCTVVLQTLLHKPVVSASEAQARLPPIGRMLGFFELSEDLTRLLGPLAEEARSVTVESFRTEALWADYESSFGRMFTAYTSTGNPGYLEDLLILCSAEHSGETGRERTRRTNELALVLSELGRAFGGTSHFLAAEEIQRQVVSSIDRSDPSWIRYRANAAAYMLARLTSLSEPVLPSLEELRALLPPLPFDESLAAAEGIGAAYSVRMQIEIAAALELLPPADEEHLTLALDAAEIAARLQDPLDTPSSGKGEIEAVAAWTRALRAAKRKEPIADHDLNALTRMLADPDRFPTVYDIGFMAAYEVIRAAPAARPSLRTSLLASAGATRPQAGEQLRRTLKIYVLLVELMIVDGEVSKDRERWGDISMTAILLIQVAANVAWREPRRAPGGQSLRSATSQGRELALHFAREGAAEIAAMLCQNSAAMLARDAVMRARPVPQLTDELLGKPLVAAQRGARLLLLTGRDEIAVLMREPQAEWRLESEHSNAAVERFADFPWMAETGVDQPFALDAWLTELAPVLDELIGEPLARLRSLTSDPILCLPTGVLATYPLALASRAETGALAPLVIVPGPLADGVVESLLTPLPARPEVSVIAGAAQLAGTGTIDVQRDLEAIRGAGIEPSLIDSAGDDIGAKLGAADAIHFCGHLVPAGPDDTEFVFADGSLLPLSEVRSMRFERTRVVTLVSCSSGFWPSRAADQVEHAAGAFLEAGAGVVIASLWPIFDHPAFVFTEVFYRCVGRGEPIATAYTTGIEAIRSYRPELLPYERPMHWAGLTLFAGNASWWGEMN